MITAKEAIDISTSKDAMWEEFQAKQDKEIRDACNNGKRSALWVGVYATYERNEQAYKQRYKEQGYYFKPIGMCGGVWQVGEYICW